MVMFEVRDVDTHEVVNTVHFMSDKCEELEEFVDLAGTLGFYLAEMEVL